MIARQIPDGASATSGVDANRLVTRAVAAVHGWTKTAPLSRAKILSDLAQVLSDGSEDLARLMVEEVGKPITEARFEVAAAIDMVTAFAAWPYWGRSSRIGEQSGGVEGHVILKPRGTVVLITPWNYPISNPIQKIAAGLVTGNAIVWRPSPRVPRCSEALAAIFERLGLPEGVFSSLLEAGSEGAAALVADPRVSAISFTGSSSVGARIFGEARSPDTIVQCEMGGKNAAVVLFDANLEIAADRIVAGAFGFAGQKCTALSRVFVEAEVADKFQLALKAAAGATVFGDPADGSTQVGPVISPEKRMELDAVVEGACARGLKPLAVEYKNAGDVSGDAFFAPHIFLDVPRADPLMREEFFGPILAVGRVADLDNAIEAVNDSPYGLAAAIFTSDRSKARRFAAEVEAGTVKINEATPGLSVMLPATGWKSSGAGPGELADESIRFFTKATAVIG